MKNSLFVIVFFLFLVSLPAQNITKFKPKFFSLHNAKFSMGLGLEGTLSPLIINLSTPSDINVIFKSPLKGDSAAISYASAGLSFDFYSPNSLLGLTFGAYYSYTEVSVSDISNNTYDFFDMRRLEFPAYIRIRPGSRDAKGHPWILIGGVFNYPLVGSRDQLQKSYLSYNYVLRDNSSEQFKSFISLSSAVGFEFFVREKNNSRIVAYLNMDYPIGDALNSEYKEFKSGGNSPIADYNFKLRQLRSSIGIKYFFGFRNYKKAASNK